MKVKFRYAHTAEMISYVYGWQEMPRKFLIDGDCGMFLVWTGRWTWLPATDCHPIEKESTNV